MADSTLQERLRNHAKAFDGLLSLIPAKMYYGEDNSDQWQRKKQTKAEAAEARRNKLDPDSELNKSAKEIMDEQARRKRKLDAREDGDDEDEWSDVDGVDREIPGQGLKKTSDASKKQKTAKMTVEEEKELAKEEKKQAKKERKAERKKQQIDDAALQRRILKGANAVKVKPRQPKADGAEAEAAPSQTKKPQKKSEPSESIEEDDAEPAEQSDMDEMDVAGIEQGSEDASSASSPTSAPVSPTFDVDTPADSTGQAPSTTTSVSSVAPSEKPDKPRHIKIPADTTALRERLAARIQALRAARKADGPDGQPIRTRQELIESRRKKQAERKAHKKELRIQAKVEEDRKREEALASARNSPGSMLSPSVDLEDTNFAFGRVAFGDGAQLSHDLSYVVNNAKKKGASDPKTALQKLENQKKRLEDMDEEKRKDVEEKEAWLVARKRAQGEKIRDNESLLKKAVKRKEKSKKKSDKEWADRSAGVNKSIRERQRKREENIKKRKDDKMLHKLGGKKKGGASKKPKARPGFEGSFGGKRK